MDEPFYTTDFDDFTNRFGKKLPSDFQKRYGHLHLTFSQWKFLANLFKDGMPSIDEVPSGNISAKEYFYIKHTGLDLSSGVREFFRTYANSKLSMEEWENLEDMWVVDKFRKMLK